jgi:hypothetical protein
VGLAGALLAAACSSGGGGGTPEQQFVREVAEALGGVSAVQNTKTLHLESVVEGEGEAYWIGENRNPDADLPVFRALYRWAFDWENGRYRKEELKLPQFVSSSDAMRQTTMGLDGDIAYDVGADLKYIKLPDDVVARRKLELHMHPVGLIKAALAEGAQIAPVKTSGGTQSTEIALPDGSLLTLVVDGTSKLPSKISGRVAHPIIGDAAYEFEFNDYGENGGVMVPANVVMRLDNKVVGRFRAVTQTVNFDAAAPIPDAAHSSFLKNVRFEIPPVMKTATAEPRYTAIGADSIASMPVEVEAAAPGVWFLKGGEYFSVLVELDDHLTLIEAPVDERRFDAIIAKAKELAPNKPVTELVITHHHFDHLGGVRAAIDAGLTLYVRGNAPSKSISPEMGRAAPSLRSAASFFEDLASRPHTIQPDRLAKSQKTPVIKTVDDTLVLGGKARTIELYPIDGSEYADTLLMAYLPKEKLLVEADVYTPPQDIYNTKMLFPFTPNLVENIQSRKLQVERILALHGKIATMEELVKATTTVPSAMPVLDPSFMPEPDPSITGR